MLAAAMLAAAVETALVASNSLSGTWRIVQPDAVSLDGVSAAKFGTHRERYCRIDETGEDLKVHCLGPYLLKDGDGWFDGAGLHLAWGSMMLRFAIDATVHASARFEGVFAAKLSGIRYDDPQAVTGTRLVLAGAHPDPAGLAQTLDDALAHLASDGVLGTPNDAKAIAQSADDIALPTAKELARLGPVTMTIYLGEEPAYSLYDVEFARGNRLCALHRRADGVLDAFVCT